MRFLRTVGLIAFGVVLAAVAGLAYGAVGQGGMINGCFKNSTPHNLQVLDPAVTTTCPTGTSPLNWNQQGPSNAYSTYHDARQNVNSGSALTTVGSLKLPPGGFVIIAKADFGQESSDNATIGRCTLSAGSDTDSTEPQVNWMFPGMTTSTTFTVSPLSLTVVHTFKSGGSAVLACGMADDAAYVTDVKITAIKVANLSNIAF
jgi:hypothetical protein